MHYLDRFEYDIFLSYSWSGNPNEDIGERAWVAAFQARLKTEMQARLRLETQGVSIFADFQSTRNGDTDERFRTYMRQSAIVLAIVTPGFCSRDSYCRKELDWFFREGRPISCEPLDMKKRLFKIIRRPVRDKDEPEIIRGHSSYLFYGGDPTPECLHDYDPLPVDEIDKGPDSRIRKEFNKLAKDLEDFLRDQKLSQVDNPVKRVFLAETDGPEKAQVLQAIRNRDVISCPPTVDMTEEEFVAATDKTLAQCDWSLHLINTAEPLTSPPNWKHSIVETQLLRAQLVQKPAFRYIVWCDAQRPIEDAALQQLMDKVGPSGDRSNRVDYVGRGVQYLLEHLKEQIARGPLKETPLQPAPSGRRVFIRCKREEIDKLQPAIRKLESIGLGVEFPRYGGTTRQRDALNKERIKESDGILIYWGGSDDVHIDRFCKLAVIAYGPNVESKRTYIGIDPPEDFWRQRVTFAKFRPLPFSHKPDELDEQLLRRAFL